MKVLQHTSARLAIQERLLGIWLLSLGTVLTGMFMFFLFEPPVDWIGAALIALGGTFAVSSPTETLTFDKTTGHLTLHRQRLLGQQTLRYPMSEVVVVKTEAVDVLGSRFYRVYLQMMSGESILITRTLSTDWPQQQMILRHIRGFLNHAAMPPTLAYNDSSGLAR